MKRYFKGLIFLAIICVFACSSCSRNEKMKTDTGKEANGKKVIYASFYPVEDLTKRIVGDKMEVRTIIKANQEPHSFELSTDDMKNLTGADLIVYNGAGMESFIDDLKKSINDDDKFLDLSQGLSLLDSSDEASEQKSINPHTWLSIKNAMEELDTIYKKVSSIDPANDAYYKANLDKSVKEFADLDKEFEDELSKVKSKDKYFVVSHAAFNYLADDYGLKQVAVTGISPEDEPSAKQLKTIADFVKAHKIKTIFFEGKATPKVAETLAKNTNTKTSTLYTLENLNEEEAQNGYINLMRENLKNLVASFNE